MTTKGTIIEQCLTRLGETSVAANVTEGQIAQLVGQSLATVMKTEFLTVQLPAGETIPAGCILATYEDIVVEPWKDRSRVKLPAIPVLLPRNIGLYHIGDNDCPDEQWVPAQAGQGAQIKTQKLINDLLGKIWYELEGEWVVANKDVSKRPDGTERKVRFKLAVWDLSKYGDYDFLPVTPDMERQVITDVINFFMGTPRPDHVVDSVSEPTKQATA